MQEKKSLIQSIDRAAAVLEVVRNAPGAMRNCDIAEAVGLSPKTTHNIVRALQANGYLAQGTDREYEIGPAALALMLPIQRKFEWTERGGGIVVKLAKSVNSTIFLGFEYYGRLYCALLGRPDGILECCGRQLWLDVLHASGPGLIMIGVKGIDWFRSVSLTPPIKFTAYTVVDMDQIAERCAKFLEQGYVLLRSEHVERVDDLAVPVRNRQGKIVAGLSMSFMESQMLRGEFDLGSAVEQLRDASAKLSMLIG